MMPSGRAIMRLKQLELPVFQAELVERHDALLPVEDAQPRFSPWLVGRLATREATTAPDILGRCGRPAARGSRQCSFSAITLMRTAIAGQ